MTEAHGGLEAWRALGSMTFVDSWSTGLAGRVTMETGSRRAVLELTGSDAVAAWDGAKVWSVHWPAEMPPPRFLVGLNWYFLNLPWLVHDPGVRLAEEGTVTVGDDPTQYVAVRMTFGEGVGDTPDDYYLLYIHPETWRLHGCEYVVTYDAILPDGVEHTPPHDLIFEEFTETGGLVLPTAFTVYNKDGTVYASCRVEEWNLDEPFDEARLEMPDGAVLDESQP
ncbi:MAG TPA: hypothetical protein VKU85_09955 [bacterium]|nr:hypothetical protein [bacterium]